MESLIERVVDRGDFMPIQRDFAPNIIIGFGRLRGEPSAWSPTSRCTAQACSISIPRQGGAVHPVLQRLQHPHLHLCRRAGLPSGRRSRNTAASSRHGSQDALRLRIRHRAEADHGGAESLRRRLSGDVRQEHGRRPGMRLAEAEIAVMGAEGAVNMLYRREIQSADDPAEKRNLRVDQYREAFANPFVAAARGFVDDMIRAG